MIYQPRICSRCGVLYVPIVDNQKYCFDCGPIAKRERVKSWKETHREAYAKKELLYNRAYMRNWAKTPKGRERERNKAKKRDHQMRTAGKLNIAGFYAKCDSLGWYCRICGRELTRETATIDHIIPIVHGGTNDINNLQPLCRKCNCKKSARSMKEMLGSEFLFE